MKAFMLLLSQLNLTIVKITVSEVTIDTRRKVLGTTVDILYPVGTVTVLSIAYFITEWRYLQITLSLFTIPISILIW